MLRELKNILRIRVLVALIIFYQTGIVGQNNRLEGVESDIENLMTAFHAVGLAVAVIQNDKVVYCRGFGYGNLENKKPATSNTLFGIGSITKQFTAGLIGIMEDQEKLSRLDRPSQYIPGLSFYNNEMNVLVNIEDLMAHRSGLGNLDGAMVFFPTKDLLKNLERLPHLTPSSQVRERMDYSNMGYSILGAITESIYQKKWSEIIEKEIFDPLDMGHSNTTIDELIKSDDFSHPYSVSDNQPVKVEFDPLFETSPGGSINSSVMDMSHWIRMLLAGGTFNGRQIISKGYLESAFSGQNLVRRRFAFDEEDPLLFDQYGYGFAVNNYYGHYRVQHSGAVSGFTGSLELYPFDDLGIVVLTNQHLSSLSGHVVDIIARRLLKMPKKEWTEYDLQISQARLYNEPIHPINEKDKPSLPLRAYCGKYVHKGYGTVVVTLKNENLFATFPAFELGLEHDEGDVFFNKSIIQIHQNCPSFNFTFRIEQGKVLAVSVPFQQQAVEFKRY